MVTRGRRGRGGRSHARQGRLRETKTGSSTAGGGPVFRAAPSPVRSARSGAGGPKSMAQLSAKRAPISPSRTCGKGVVSKQSRTSAPRPPSTGPSSLHPSAPVELPLKVVAPIEQVAQKRKATSPLDPRPTTRPTNSPSPTRWELAHSRIKGRFKDYITPPFETIADLPCEPASRRW